jgi:hypothetical protein
MAQLESEIFVENGTLVDNGALNLVAACLISSV